jgi:c-di-GMP-binding flagellar brake protein YcgR
MQRYALENGRERAGAGHTKLSGRAHRRWKCTGPAEVRVYPEGSKASGSLVDLSLHGCCVQLGAPLDAGAFARVEVLFSVKGNTLQLAGVIRHREDNLRAGIEFTNVSVRKQEEIKSVVIDLLETQQLQGYVGRRARAF